MDFHLPFFTYSGSQAASAEPLTFLIGLLALLLLLLWVVQFVKLMSLEDRDFPGQYARFAWVGAFLVFPMFGPVAFWFWNLRVGPGEARRPPRNRSSRGRSAANLARDGHEHPASDANAGLEPGQSDPA